MKHSMFSPGRIQWSAVACMLALAVTQPKSQIVDRIEYGQSPNMHYSRVYVNFAQASASGEQYGVWTDPAGVPNRKTFYSNFEVTGPGLNQSTCWEFSTASVTGGIPNLRIWLFIRGPANPQYKSVAFGASTVKIRAWTPNAVIGPEFEVSANDANANAKDFMWIAQQMDGKNMTKDQCRIAGKPFLDYSVYSPDANPAMENTN